MNKSSHYNGFGGSCSDEAWFSYNEQRTRPLCKRPLAILLGRALQAQQSVVAHHAAVHDHFGARLLRARGGLQLGRHALRGPGWVV